MEPSGFLFSVRVGGDGMDRSNAMNDDTPDWAAATLAIRTGHRRTAECEHSEPIFATSSYVFGSAAEAAARFSGDSPGNIYSRFTNPTVRAFEERLAALEGGEACVATASGMSAILTTCMGLLQHGDHIVSSRSIFGSTTILFNKVPRAFRHRDRLRDPERPGRLAAQDQAEHPDAVRRDAVEPADRAGRYPRAGGPGPRQRLRAGGRQLFLYPGTAAPAGTGCGHRRALRDQVPSTARAGRSAAPWSATASGSARTSTACCAPRVRR